MNGNNFGVVLFVAVAVLLRPAEGRVSNIHKSGAISAIVELGFYIYENPLEFLFYWSIIW